VASRDPALDPEDVGPADATDFVARLLHRPPPEAYLEAWTRSLRRRAREDERAGRFSVGLFRVADELFALRTEHVVEVQPVVPVRSVPGRSGDVFRGLVSLRGEIHLCASLGALLGLDAHVPTDDEAEARRLLVVRHQGARWVLLVDAVLDFERYEAQALGAAQVTVAKSAVHFTEGVVTTPHGTAALIDVRRLFEGLDRSLA
jgi:chemotaxis-related protein WspD